MSSMDNGTLFIRTEKLEETADHISRLSIRMMMNGEQWYKVGGVDRKLHDRNFLVIDQGQHYRTAFESTDRRPVTMAVVAFKPGMAEDVRRTLTSSHESLLDDPAKPQPPIGFFEHTHAMDEVVRSSFIRLHEMVMGDHTGDQAEASLLHDRLMEHLISIQEGLIIRSEKINALRRTTRLEIWKRLNRARDLMEACCGEDLSISFLARTACLSEHHFKRLFKQAFGTPPHRFLIALRMQKAQNLLRSKIPVSAVAAMVGHADVSAFIRSYRNFHGRTPGDTIHLSN